MGGQAAEGVLAPPAVVGLLDPDDDRQAQLFAGNPAPAVEDVLLQQAEGGLHGGIVDTRANAAHRAAQPGIAQGGNVAVRPELGGFKWSSQHLERGGVWADRLGG
jgi:hypothetical protein